MIKNIHIIGSLKTGGVEKVIETLFSTNAYSNHFFLVLDKKNNNDINLPRNTKITYCNGKIFNFIITLLNSDYDIYNFWLHPSIITSLLIFLKRRKIIWHIHNSNINLRYLGFKNFIFACINSLCSHFVPNKIIFCSLYSMQCHKKFFFSEKKFLMIRNPILKNKIIQKKNYNFSGPLKFVMVANFTKAKNFKKLFEIISHIYSYNFILDIYGYGVHENKYLKKLISKYYLNKSVNLMNFTKTDNLYHKYDYKFLVSNTESSPMTIVESIISNTPCLCSDVSDLKNIYKKNIYIIPNKINDDFINYINNLYDMRKNITLYKSLCSSSKAKVEKIHRLDLISKRYSYLWSKI